MADPNGSLTSVAKTLEQLDGARKLVLGDAALYYQIIQGILPLIGPDALLELQRWGADFLAEAFTNPRLPKYDKQQLCTLVLGTIKGMLDIKGEDPGVLKSAILASASLYPLVFSHILIASHDIASWETMTAIKAKILRMWDSTTLAIRICCIKFAQNVVMAQTQGAIGDPRKFETNDISVSMVPQGHPLMAASNLEAEAQGLLDRMLDIYQMNGSDALSVDATINCLSVLIRNRPSTYNKVITATLNFNPLKDASPSMSARTRVTAKSMERTTKAFLLNANKRNPQHPLSARIQQYVDRLLQSRTELFDTGPKKREAPTEPTDGLDQTKRAKLGADIPTQRIKVPPLPLGPTTFSQLFTVTRDESLSSFHVEQLPVDMVAKITLSLLSKIDQDLMNDAINGIRARYVSLQHQAPAIQSGVTGVDDEEDDYEPEFVMTEDNEQILNKLDNDSSDRLRRTSEVALAPFNIPQPPALSTIEAERLGETMMQRLLDAANSSGASHGLVKKGKPGLHRLAGGGRDVDSWKAVVIRLIARGDLGAYKDQIKSEDYSSEETPSSLNDVIRNALYMYILDDFRSRMITAFDWLNEEWYNDRLHAKVSEGAFQHYDYWVMRLLNGIFPYVDARDKNLLIRFLSEVPEITAPLLEKFKDLAKDPERVIPVVNALYYLVLFRPPSKELALDALEDLWRNYEGARTSAGKMLSRYRPHITTDSPKPNGLEGTTERAISAQ